MDALSNVRAGDVPGRAETRRAGAAESPRKAGSVNLTNEVLEMWEADARAGCRDTTKANARIVRLVSEVHESTVLLKATHDRLRSIDPEYDEASRRAEEL